MGITPLMLFLACMMVARNQRIAATWQAHPDEDARRTAARQPHPQRTSRHHELTAATAPP
jgi:hypothetical protein